MKRKITPKAEQKEIPAQRTAVENLSPDVVHIALIAATLLSPTQQSPNVVEAAKRAIMLYDECAEQMAEWPPAVGAPTKARAKRNESTPRPRG